MTEVTMCCWICCHTGSEENSVVIVNDEMICEECMRELAQIEEECGAKSKRY